MSAFYPVFSFFTRKLRFTHPQTGEWTITQFVQRKRHPIGQNGQPVKFDEEIIIFAASFTDQQIDEIRSRTYNLFEDFYLVENCLPDHGMEGYSWIIAHECTNILNECTNILRG